MRLLSILGSALLISGCSASIESERPLFAAGSDSFKPGMWAAVAIDKPCDLPRNTDIFTWPDCAAPVLFKDGAATYFAPGHVTVRFELADGTPRIIQADRDIVGGLMGQSDKARPVDPNRRFYASFYPSSGAPFTEGRLQFLSCQRDTTDAAIDTRVVGKRNKKQPDPDNLTQQRPKPEKPIAGLRRVDIDDELHCIADTPDAVREVARRASPDESSLKLVWIGSYP